MRQQIQILASSTMDIFYPNHCEVCEVDLGLNEQHICISCLYDLPFIKDAHQREQALQKIFWGRVDVKQTVSLLNYQKGNQVQDILHLIKYKGKKKLAQHLGKKLGEKINQSDPVDYVVPVPLHPKKMRLRGFNQAGEIAKGVGEAIQAKVKLNHLKRNHHNASQTTVTKYERWENVRQIFEVRYPKKLINKHILLVDDVLTTGATLEACIKPLIQIKGSKVSVATLAARV